MTTTTRAPKTFAAWKTQLMRLFKGVAYRVPGNDTIVLYWEEGLTPAEAKGRIEAVATPEALEAADASPPVDALAAGLARAEAETLVVEADDFQAAAVRGGNHAAVSLAWVLMMRLADATGKAVALRHDGVDLLIPVLPGKAR